jgi:hypothetical protein
VSNYDPKVSESDFLKWWEHRPFMILSKSDCELAWNAALASRSVVTPTFRLELEEIVRVASGEKQVANDDTEGMAWIDKFARKALAEVGRSVVTEPQPSLEEKIEKLPAYYRPEDNNAYLRYNDVLAIVKGENQPCEERKPSGKVSRSR